MTCLRRRLDRAIQDVINTADQPVVVLRMIGDGVRLDADAATDPRLVVHMLDEMLRTLRGPTRDRRTA